LGRITGVEIRGRRGIEEGITIHPRLGPNRIIGRSGKVVGLEVIEVASVFDENRRFNPKFKPGTEHVWDCDTVILAIGQTADLTALGGAEDVRLSPRGLVEINQATGQTSAPDICRRRCRLRPRSINAATDTWPPWHRATPHVSARRGSNG
jgi:NADPH-dependent glutamate synthase beta subunit-like oxidoreductase